jgi:hypothetical protein
MSVSFHIISKSSFKIVLSFTTTNSWVVKVSVLIHSYKINTPEYSPIQTLAYTHANQSTTESRILLQNVVVAPLAKNYSSFRDTVNSLSCLEELTTGPCPVPDESSP